jgi:3-phenylpropionate/cinnamic acid dioxygenase small subunit
MAELTAQDRSDVMSLIASYAMYIDAGNVDGYVNNFMPDATFQPISRVIQGQEAIREFANNLVSSGRAGGDPATMRHFLGIPQIKAEGADRCKAQTYCVVFDYNDDKKIRVPLVARYEDEIVKHDGKWRFQKRVIHAELGR